MPQEQFYIILVAATARALVLVIAAFSGTICIYLGWKLYRDSILSSTKAEAITSGGFKLRLASAGPGVFFVAFGAWLLVHVVDQDFRAGLAQTPPVKQGVVGPQNILARQEPFNSSDLNHYLQFVADGPKAVETKCTSSPPPVTSGCIAQNWGLKFWDGRTPPNPGEFQEAIGTAIAELRKALKEEYGEITPPAEDRRLEVIRLLQYLMGGIIR